MWVPVACEELAVSFHISSNLYHSRHVITHYVYVLNCISLMISWFANSSQIC